MRHSSSLNIILVSNNNPKPNVFIQIRVLLEHQDQPSQKYFLSIVNVFGMLLQKGARQGETGTPAASNPVVLEGVGSGATASAEECLSKYGLLHKNSGRFIATYFAVWAFELLCVSKKQNKSDSHVADPQLVLRDMEIITDADGQSAVPLAKKCYGNAEKLRGRPGETSTLNQTPSSMKLVQKEVGSANCTKWQQVWLDGWDIVKNKETISLHEKPWNGEEAHGSKNKDPGRTRWSTLPPAGTGA